MGFADAMPSATVGAILVELQVAAVRRGDLDDEPERLLEERLDLVLMPQREELAVEISLPS